MGQTNPFFLVIMASRVFHLSGLQLDQATSGSYYALIIWGTGLVRDTGAQPISGSKTFYDTAYFLSNLNVTGDFVPSGRIAGNLNPKTDNLYDLGTTTGEWRNIYCDGTGQFDNLIVDENLIVATGAIIGGSVTISGNLNVTGDFTLTGDFLPKNIANNLLPKTNNLYDLGSLSNQFKNAYFDGFVQTDDLIVDQNASIASNLTVSGDISGLGNISGFGNLGISGNSTIIGDSIIVGDSNVFGDLTIDRLFVSGTGMPTATGDAGISGQFAIGNGYLFICTGTNAWARTHLTGWT